ncbi:TetR/AcrR family transcriptional regulator [Streptomyces sp. NPDC020875]|uniref:TetR/AcrR family transcriptional regulator n=1 Tax=Streptomyces sp. NPDC020875 TaxID=3154898 RepID=UPI0033FE24C3
MGHREDLLEGAKRCLLEKGYARTTARDVVAASGTNLASIGYHYGSKEALLQAAFLALMEAWGDSVDRPADAAGLPGTGPERFEAVWERVVAGFPAHRALWKLQIEVVARLDEDEKLAEAVRGWQVRGRDELAQLFGGIDAKGDPDRARGAGLLAQALVAGVMTQWLVDPDTAPTADDLAEGLKALAGIGT